VIWGDERLQRAIPTRRLTLVLAVVQIAVAALVLGGVELALLFAGPEPSPPWVAALFVAGAWAYAAAGVIAWLRRPGSLMGLLMTGAAFVWLVAGLYNTTIPVLIAAALIVATVVIALVIHLLLAFPSGRLPDRGARLTVLAAYAVALIGQVPLYLFSAGNPLTVADRPDLVTAGHWVQRSFGALVVASTCLLLARRLRELPPTQRRVLAPLSVYGIFAVLLIPVTSAIGDVFGTPLTQATVQLSVMICVPIAFAVAASRGGFARTGEIAELGTQLGDGGRTELAELLASTLGDDTVELLFRVPGEAGWVTSAGVGAVPPAASDRRGVAPVELGGETIGAIVYDATLLTRPDEVREATRVVALALDRERLAVELRASRARLVETGDSERRRIARDLHDGLQSRLVLLAVQAGVAPGASPELREGIEAAIDELRALVHGVMPAELTERGLPAAVKGLADRMPIDVALDIDGFERRPAPAIESTAFFVTAEAMINAVKHAQARELTVTLARGAERLDIDVRDDGIGGAGSGNGIRSMTDRAEALGGVLWIESAPGTGTRVHVELPCAS
jgi:signal transduction histidine kinase